jgi:hypothetical protein
MTQLETPNPQISFESWRSVRVLDQGVGRRDLKSNTNPCTAAPNWSGAKISQVPPSVFFSAFRGPSIAAFRFSGDEATLRVLDVAGRDTRHSKKSSLRPVVRTEAVVSRAGLG